MRNRRKILVMGLPGAGKTTLSAALAKRLNAVHLNADAIRANVNKDLGFSPADRIEQARRMGFLADTVAAAGGYVVADFVCPTPATREAFGRDATVVFVDRLSEGRFADTNALFRAPDDYDVRVTAEGAPEYWAEQVCRIVRPIFDWTSPTALFVGRFQPFHDGHAALVDEGVRRIGQACVAVRATGGADDGNPCDFAGVEDGIKAKLSHLHGKFVVIRVPDVAAVFYGREVGDAVERIDLAAAAPSTGAADVRRKTGGI